MTKEDEFTPEITDPRPLRSEAWRALPGSAPAALEAHTDGCRWPIDTPGRPARFCNEPVEAGAVYCPVHRALGMRPGQ